MPPQRCHYRAWFPMPRQMSHLVNVVPHTRAGGCGRPNQVGHRVQGLAPKVFSIELAWQNNQVSLRCRVVLGSCFGPASQM